MHHVSRNQLDISTPEMINFTGMRIASAHSLASVMYHLLSRSVAKRNSAIGNINQSLCMRKRSPSTQLRHCSHSLSRHWLVSHGCQTSFDCAAQCLIPTICSPYICPHAHYIRVQLKFKSPRSLIIKHALLYLLPCPCPRRICRVPCSVC